MTTQHSLWANDTAAADKSNHQKMIEEIVKAIGVPDNYIQPGQPTDSTALELQQLKAQRAQFKQYIITRNVTLSVLPIKNTPCPPDKTCTTVIKPVTATFKAGDLVDGLEQQGAGAISKLGLIQIISNTPPGPLQVLAKHGYVEIPDGFYGSPDIYKKYQFVKEYTVNIPPISGSIACVVAPCPQPAATTKTYKPGDVVVGVKTEVFSQLKSYPPPPPEAVVRLSDGTSIPVEFLEEVDPLTQKVSRLLVSHTKYSPSAKYMAPALAILSIYIMFAKWNSGTAWQIGTAALSVFSAWYIYETFK